MNAPARRDIRIVLVNPSHPGNIGAAARAMKTMAIEQLVLVAPLEYPDPRAVWRAAGAADLLDKALVVETLDEAVGECDFLIATSARQRKIPWPLVNARACAETIFKQAEASKIAILFGREDSGLTNEELQRCNLHVHVPTNEEYGSLNLSMAVQIITYEIRMQSLALKDPNNLLGHEVEWDEPFSSVTEMEGFYTQLSETLEGLEFYDPQNPRQLMTRLRRLFGRVRLDKMELNILRGILSSVQKVIKKQ